MTGSHDIGSMRARRLAALLSGLLAVALVAVLPLTPAYAAETVSLAKSTTDVLVGGQSTVTLTATNNGTVDDYNLSYRDVLPVGVAYVAGSSSPGTLGEPQVVTTGVPAHQTLVWSNVSDLPIGEAQTLTFKVTLDPTANPVGSAVVDTANAYANSNPRTVPKFDTSGNVVAGSFTVGSNAATATTHVSAILLSKAEPSPEAELLRGIHHHPTTYTLTVTNNSAFADANTVLVDYLPAGLEFLGCGGTDNTPAGAVEYTGAPRLTATPAVPGCTGVQVPASVDTVNDLAGHAGQVYTRVEWHLGTLTPGQVVKVVYAAGIPQQQNTMTFPGGEPTAASGHQGSNLDNNSGASTRETTTEQSLTNLASVGADYAGPVAAGTPTHVTSDASHTVTAEDLAMQKSVSAGIFTQGNLASYTLNLEGGEYTSADNIVITDVLPDGMCPMGGPGVNYAGGDPQCDGDGSTAPSVAFASPPVQHADGTWTLTFSPVALAQDGTRTVTYQARMRSSYIVGGDPTSAGDAYVNHVSLTGTTTTLASVDPPGGVTSTTVNDVSSASISSDTLTLDKRIQPWTTTPYTCSTDGADYTDGADPALASFTFPEDSRVCFTVKVTFPGGEDTRNPVLTDFLPDYLQLETGSVQPMTGNTVSNVSFDPTTLTFTMGDQMGANKFARKGSVFFYRLAGIVVKPATGATPDVTGNLAKLRWTNSAGAVSSLRDREDFSIAAPPPVGVVKAATRTTSTAPGTNGPLADGSGVIRAGDVVQFSVTVQDNGSAANRNAVPVVGPDVWDRLPRGITCASVSAITDGGLCTDPTSPTQPSFSGNTTRSAVRWNLPDTITIAAGATKVLTYRIAYPASIATGRSYKNDVDVASYASSSDRGTLVQHFPATNVDTTVPAANIDVPVAHDDHTLLTTNPSVAKTNTTGTADTTQGPSTTLHYATLGETVTYSVLGTVPAATTVYAGKLFDTTPTGMRVDGVTYDYSSDGGATFGPLPGTFTTSTTSPGPTVTFPAVLDAGAQSDQVRMTITSTVTNLGALVHGGVVTNTARFNSTTEWGAANTQRNGASSVTIAEPNPSPTKSASPTAPVANQTVTFTLTASDVDPAAATTIRPTLFDALMVDCVPAALAVVPGSLSLPSASVAAMGTNGCASDRTPIVWNLGDLAWRLPAVTPWPVLTYQAVVDPGAAGGATYTNTATLTGSSMSGTDPDERGYAATASAAVTVPAGTLTKTVTPDHEPVGGTVGYTLGVDLPANVNFYDATISDLLPAGIDPASVVLTDSTCAFTDPTAGPCSVLASSGTSLTPVGQLHGWSLGSVASSLRPRHVTVSYTAVVGVVAANVAGQPLPNSAQLLWNLTDHPGTPTLADTYDQHTEPGIATVTVQEPNLSIDKSVDIAAPVPGQAFTYTIKVTNATGANVSPANELTVVDTVPAGVVPVTPIANGGVLSGNTITWTGLGPIAAAANLTLGYQAHLASPAPSAAQTNTADITHYTSLPGGAGRVYDGPSDTAVVTAGLPKLTIDKTLLDGPPSYIGLPTRWQLVVTNTGPATAHDVDVTDVLPTSWTYDGGSAQVSVAGAPPVQLDPATSGAPVQTLAWGNLADLATGQSIVIVLSSTPDTGVVPSRVGSSVAHVNSATTTGQDLDGAAGSVVTTDTDTAQTHIDSADVEIDKAAVGTPVAGKPFSWTMTVTNHGPDTAVGPFVITDDLPALVTGATATGTGWTCSVAGTTLTCQRTNPASTLASTVAFPVITVTAAVPATTAPGAPLANQAAVTDATHDPVPGNNSDSTTNPVAAVADMGIDKALVGPLVPGTDATYTIDVDNAGPSVAHGPITVSDSLQAGLTFQSFSGAGWELSRSGQQLTFTWTGALPAPIGSLPQIAVTVSVGSNVTGAVTNTASVTEPTDPTSGPEEADSDSVTTTPAPRADLGITKDSVTPFEAGTQGTYELTVHNFGPSDAAGPITVTDPLPASLTYDSVSSGDGSWTCGAVGQAVTCNHTGGLALGASTTFQITVDIDPGLNGAVHNTATVHGTTPDPNSGNDAGSDDTGIDVKADLAITKTLTTSPVVAGADVDYDLDVQNLGPATSPGPITVTDTLPAGLDFASASGTGWACDSTGQVVTCTHAATLASGGHAQPITVVATVESGVGPVTLTNVASVEGTATDTNPDNNTSSVPTPVTEHAEISLAKSVVGADPVRAGEDATFEVVVSSAGPSDARDVAVDDLLPAGLSLVSIGGPGWSCSGTTCTIDRIVAGTPAAPITVVATVAAGTPDGDSLVNTASATTATPGDDPSDDSDTATVDVIARADLELDKAHTGGDVAAGTPTDFTLTVTNHGPSDAVGPLTITDTLPAGMSYLSASAPWSCTPGAGSTVACTVAAGLLAGATAPTLTFQVLIDAASPVGTLTNSATVSSGTTDPVPGNDSDTADVGVVQQSDLAIVKTHTGTAHVGDPLTWQLAVSNAGPSVARDVEVTDDLPAGLQYVSADGPGWTCSEAAGTVTCDLTGTLAPAASADPITLVTTVLPGAYPTITNTADVDSSTPDGNLADDTSDDTVTVPALVDLTIAKSHRGTLVVGQPADYAITVTNAGPTAAPGPITVVDTLPSGLTFVSGGGDGFACSAGGAAVTCVRTDPLGVGQSATIALRVDVEPAAYPRVVNAATVSSDAEETDPSNNAASDPADVTPTVKLELVKKAVSVDEDRIVYTLTVTNDGPSATVPPVKLRDPLPAGLRLVSVSGSGWSCTTPGDLAACSYGDPLAAGDHAAVRLVADVTADPGTRIRNVGHVSGGGSLGSEADAATVSVPGQGQVQGPGSGHATGPGGYSGGVLPNTGGPALWVSLLGLLLAMGGGALLLAGRRRRTGD